MLALPSAAFAGGFEFPDNGTEALGRGGAFTAKADSPLGARVQRRRPGASSAARACSFDAQPGLPQLRRSSAPAPIPTRTTRPAAAAVRRPALPEGDEPGGAVLRAVPRPHHRLRQVRSLDLRLRRATARRRIGNKVWGVDGDAPNGTSAGAAALRPRAGQPAHRSSRRCAAAVRATHWLDIGVALHLVVGIFDLQNVVDHRPRPDALSEPRVGRLRRDDAPHAPPASPATGVARRSCSTRTAPSTSASTCAAPIVLNTSGTVDATPPPAAPIPLRRRTRPSSTRACRRCCASACATSSSASTTSSTATSSSTAPTRRGTGPRATATRSTSRQLGPFSDIHPTLTHHYQDTFSVRLGGAYNVRLPAGVLTLRLGGYFDSAATKLQGHARSTSTPWTSAAAPAGLGYSVRGVIAQPRLRVHLRARSQRHQRRHPVDQRRGQRLDA